jgi:hypothetical protein
MGQGISPVNAAEQAQLGALLDMGLAHAGLEVVRGEVQAGNVVGWRALSGAEVVGQLLARKLAVRLRGERGAPGDAGPQDPAPSPAARTVTGEVPGRADMRAMLRIVRGGA